VPQDSASPVIGQPALWEGLTEGVKLKTLKTAFENVNENDNHRVYPFYSTAKHIFENPRVIKPGLLLSLEILLSYMRPGDYRRIGGPS
jgi:hypothetical protein